MGALKFKPHGSALFKRERELRQLSGRIESPAHLAQYLAQIPSLAVRQAVFNRIKPWLKFKLNADQNPVT